jgi:16S rRNA processing protein RimM
MAGSRSKRAEPRKAQPAPAAKRGGAPKPDKHGKAEKAEARPAPIVLDRSLVALAEVARPHGIQGELRLKVYNPDSDFLARRPRVGLHLPDGSVRESTIVSAREVDKALLVRLAGVDDRDAAELLRGAVVAVPRSALPPAEEGEFYAHDVEGARAVLASGEAVGRVTGLASYPTCDVLVIERDGGKKIEVPLIDAYVARVDVAAGLVELVTIDGLD